MVHTYGQAFQRMGLTYAWGVVALVAASMFFGLGPRVEEKAFPVLTSITPHDITIAEGVLRFYFDADKQRDCELVGQNWYGSAGAHFVPLDVAVVGHHRPASYPPGHIVTGPYTAQLPDISPDVISHVGGSLDYSCHPFWQTRQIVGPFSLPGVLQ